jgi:molecular chaperone HtpG
VGHGLKRALRDRVSEVRVSRRLTESPACLVIGEHDPGEQMRRILEATGQEVPDTRPALEINPGHPLVRRLDSAAADGRFEDLAHVLFDQAQLAEGRQLRDPGAFVARLNRLLLELDGDPARSPAAPGS